MKRLKMRQNQTKDHLFTFGGLDGCGKTTMLAMLKADMEQEHNVFLTKQPTNAVRESSRSFGIRLSEFISSCGKRQIAARKQGDRGANGGRKGGYQ